MLACVRGRVFRAVVWHTHHSGGAILSRAWGTPAAAEALHPDGVLAGLEQASDCNTQQCPPMGEEETPEHRAAVPSISALYGQSPC